ncbi:PD40 domain-containing protein, partial [Candidatus Poribacteria bacterium]|nr:PD40 domain-containing protein [Candidatus Poribacteria bacterium]
MKRTYALSVFSLILLLSMSICAVSAKAPTTSKILFSSTRDGNWEVYMMNPDGSEQVNLTQHPADDSRAVWSPTGEQILFVSTRGGNHVRDLYVMDADGTNVRRVFKKKIRAWRKNATWSPDGKRFAYIYEDWNRFEFGMYLGTFGEEDVELLPNGRSPAWSPDGSEIAYTLAHALGSRLTFLNVDTRDQEQPIPDKALQWQHSPSWSAAGDRLAISGTKHPIPAIL